MLTLKQKGALEAFREHAPAIADHMIANLQSPWWTSILDNSLSTEQIAAEIRNADPEQRLLSYTYAATLELALMRLTSEQLPDPESLSATCPASDTDEWYRVLGHYGFTLNIGPHSATVTRGAGEEYVFFARAALDSFVAGVAAGENRAVEDLVVTIIQALGDK